MGLGGAPFLFRSAPLFGLSSLAALERAVPPDASFAESRYTPHYPVRSPLEDILRLVNPGSDEYVTELYAHEIGLTLHQWSDAFKTGELSAIRSSLDDTLESCAFAVTKETALRTGFGIESVRREFASTLTPGADHLLRGLKGWIGDGTRIESAEFEITSLQQIASDPLILASQVRYSIVARGKAAQREQRVGSWTMHWKQHANASGTPSWKVSRWQVGIETRSVTNGPGFEDITERALGRTASYRAQLLRGADHWRTVLDGACGIDVYGNNGVAAGDFDGDGLDDVYICQAAGLPNRLYQNRGDGTFDDVTEQAGVGVLDNTACALFADLRNTGMQDLIVVCGSGPLLFLNQGNGTFVRKENAFEFALPAQGTFTHAAVADYDGDGRLDIYFCLYSYYLGLDQYHYPAPYFDARNGPPNFLFHNEGDGTFTDQTSRAGLNAENNRYSFSCAWGRSGTGTAPDLYVVNDFGRNNLYRNHGDGTFSAASEQAHVEDVGAGMSACWTDYNNNGLEDLYVANMWSAAGQRVSEQARFHQQTPESTRNLYRQHARGNAMYRNRGDGTFESAGDKAGLEVGRWAWSSDAWDFDHDGFPDIYVTNGYITAPARGATASSLDSADTSSEHVSPQIDLGSFFWRQVVAKSPEDATPSQAYERGWNALNELIRSDRSWSGLERNAMFANNRDGTFSELSGAVGLDFLEDGRSFALTDLNNDGRLEIIVKNRNAPQLRILQNAMEGLGASIAFRLQGTKSNRDAIGATVTVSAGHLEQTRSLQAGSGFLSQHTKSLFFGLGATQAAVHATVHWPSGLIQQFDNLPPNHLISLTEGAKGFSAKPFLPRKSPGPPSPVMADAPELEGPSESIATWLINPLQAPAFSLPDLTGTQQALSSTRGRFTLLHLWASTSPGWREQLRKLSLPPSPASAAQLSVLALNIDQPVARANILPVLRQQRLPYPVLLATEEVAGIYNIVFRYLFDRRRDLGLPTSFLLDRDSKLIRVYQGPVQAADILTDLRNAPTTHAERLRLALPFPGKLQQGDFTRNDFTYGVAMFQHGYLEQAETSFQEVVAARPNNAEGYYNLGTLSLRRNNFTQARTYLDQTLKLKPDYPEAWNNLGMMAAQEGHSEDAIHAFRQSLALRPSYATALLNLGNVYRRGHAFKEAQQCLSSARALQPDDPEINYSLGMLLAQQNDPQAASEYLERAIALRPDYPEARNNLGVLFVRQQDYARAEQEFKDCIRLMPTFEESYLNLARLYLAQQDRAKARSVLVALQLVNPDSTTARKGLAALDATP